MTPLDDILAEAAARGLRLAAEDGHLRVRGPRGALDAALRERLAGAKEVLLAFLERDSITDDALPRVMPDPAQRHEPFALTDIQEAYWVGSGPEDGGYHYYLEFDVPGLDVARLERAWGALVERHEMLRAVVTPDGRQRILAAVPPPRLVRHDLSGLPEAEAEARQAALRRALSHMDRPLDRWPLSEIQVSLRDAGLVRVHVSLGLITLDSGSMMILFAEWQRLYEDLAAPLPRLPTSFRDYVTAERALRDTALFRRAELYWQRRLDALPPAPDLPLAPRPPGTAARFGRLTERLPATEWAALKRRAAQHGLTPSALLLAAFSEILAGWSGSPRFTLNLTLFNRLPMGEAIDAVVGDFTSVTLLEVDLTVRRPFAEHAAALSRRLRDDLDHRAYPGVRVLRDWARRQGVTGRALAPVVFSSTLVLDVAAGFSLGRLFGGTLGYAISQTPHCDLDHQLMEDDGALVFHWDVLEGRYPGGMVPAMFDSYAALLMRLATDDGAFAEARGPAVPLGQQARRDAANDTAAPMGEDTLCGLFARQVALRGDAPAVIAGGEEIGYRELDRRARQVAGRLLAEGAGQDAPVAVVMRKGWAQVAGVLGALMAGCAYLPVDPALPPARRATLLREAGVQQVLCDAALLSALEAESLRCVVVEAQPTDAPAADPRPAAPGDLAYVLFTSGSTGQPKGVMIEQRGVVQRMQDVVRRFGLGPDDRVLGLTALHHDLSVFDIFGMLCCAGGTVVLPDPDGLCEPAHWRALMAQHGVTLWNSVPAFLSMLVDELEGAAGPAPPLRWCILSGDFISVALPDRIRRLVPGLAVVAAGGPTETTVWDICDPLDAVDTRLPSIPYGRPMANARYHVLRENGDPCPDWVPGELCIAGAGLARGYWRDEAATARAFTCHPVTGERIYRSGDMGRWLPDGRIEILARQDYQVKLNGQRVELGEIEAALERLPGVARAAVVLQRLPAGEGRLAAHVVPDAVPAWDAARAEFKLGQPGLRRVEGHDAVPLPAVPDEPAAFLARQSHRRFTGRAVPATALSALLSGLRQMPVPGAALPKRLYPSAGSLYPVQCYVHIRPNGVEGLPAGFHYYDPSRHALLLVGDGNAEPYVGSNGALLQEAAFVVLLMGALDAVEPTYPGAGRDFCLLEAGHVGQVLMQRAPAGEIGLCPLGQGVDEAALRRACGLGDRHVLAYALAGGGIEPGWSGAWMAGDAGAPEVWHAPLRRALQAVLPAHMVPATFRRWSALPLTVNGKLDRNRLAEAGSSDEALAPAAPASALEARVAATLGELLGTGPAELATPFLELGAGSMTLVLLRNRLQAEFGCVIPMAEMFGCGSVRLLAQWLEEAASRSALAAARPERVS